MKIEIFFLFSLTRALGSVFLRICGELVLSRKMPESAQKFPKCFETNPPDPGEVF